MSEEDAACSDCLAVRARDWPQPSHVSFPHLRLLLEDDRDDLCEQRFHACAACLRLWREVEDSYGPGPEPLGFSWTETELSQLLRAYGDQLPRDFPREAAGLRAWLEGPAEAIRLGLF